MGHLMSALGQKQTLCMTTFYDRFTPESGHKTAQAGMSALCHEQSFAGFHQLLLSLTAALKKSNRLPTILCRFSPEVFEHTIQFDQFAHS